MNRLTLTRKYLTDRVVGSIILPSGMVLATMELPWKDNQSNVSCIPEGIYRCEDAHMNLFNVNHYQILDVAARDHVFLHAGNTVHDTKGCILVGIKYVNGVLSASRKAIGMLEEEMGRKPFILDIRGAEV